MSDGVVDKNRVKVTKMKSYNVNWLICVNIVTAIDALVTRSSLFAADKLIVVLYIRDRPVVCNIN